MNYTFDVPLNPEHINSFYASLGKFAQIVYQVPKKFTPEKLYNSYVNYEKDPYILEQLKSNYEFSEFLYKEFEYFLKNPHTFLSQEFCASVEKKMIT